MFGSTAKHHIDCQVDDLRNHPNIISFWSSFLHLLAIINNSFFISISSLHSHGPLVTTRP